MKVLLTGGTGFIGAHTATALLEAGHDVRLLVRDPRRVDSNVRVLGADVTDVVQGDITDPESVERAVEGCEAVIHAAALVSLERRHMEQTLETNLKGAQAVIDSAMRHGLDPIIHVSSVSALSPVGATVLTGDLAPATTSASPYTRSKALMEAYVRERQDEGAPITLVYPGGVLGQPAGTANGEAAEGILSMLKTGFIPLKDGGLSIVDVHDVAAVLAALVEPGRKPGRYMCGGQMQTLPEVARLLHASTGRRFPVLPIPGVVFRQLGHVVDAISHVIPLDTVFTYEAMATLTRPIVSDDSAVHDELGIAYRDVAQTMDDCIRGLAANGRLSASQAGTAKS